MKRLLRILFFALFSTVTAGPAHISVAIADEAPSAAALFAANLSDADDRTIALAGFKGKPLIVNFWARWCPPCRAEIPEFVRFRAAQKGQIEILGIGIEDKAGPVKEFAKAYDINYPIFAAKEHGIPLMKALGNTRGALPYTLFIDRNGQIIGKKVGMVSESDLKAAAELLLKK